MGARHAFWPEPTVSSSINPKERFHAVQNPVGRATSGHEILFADGSFTDDAQ